MSSAVRRNTGTSAPLKPRRPSVVPGEGSSGVSSAPQRPQLSGLLTIDEQRLARKEADTVHAEGGVQLTTKDLNRITNPRFPNTQRSARDAQRQQQDFEMKHDALLIVEQKAPNVWRLPDQDSNVNRILNSGNRDEALRTLPLAFPPVRFRRGETVDEYIDSVTKPWEQMRKHSATSLVSRRMSASGKRTHVEEIVLDAQAQKNEQLRQRHGHSVSKMWRQTHATKADIIIADQTSSTLYRPLLESATTKAIEIEEQMVSAVAASCRAGISATPRGLVVPYPYYEALVEGINASLDDTFVAFFQSAQDDETLQSLAENDVTSSSIRQLISAGGPSPRSFRDTDRSERHVDVQLPAAGHPSRHSLITVKTATHVAVLWRMLEQVQAIVPGMDTALHLLHELLPLLYVDFAQVSSLQPNVSSLSEQIKQLCSIPLVALQLQSTEANEEQFRHDSEYLRKALENWSFNIWRNYNTMERRRANHMETLHRWFQRFEARRTVSAAFKEWRLHVMQEKVHMVVNDMRSKYDQFVKSARHAAAETIPMSTNRAVAANQARFFAQRLAASSTHEKAGGSALSPSRSSMSPTSSRSAVVERATSPVDRVSPTESPQATHLQRQSQIVRATSPDGSSDRQLAPGEADSVAVPKRHFFDEVIAKLQTLEDVSGHLREYIAIQRKTIDKLETDTRNLNEKLSESRTEAKKLINENLKLNNSIQSKDLLIREQLRQVLRLKAKVRLHRHRHWRSSAMRVLSESLGVSYLHQESKDAVATSAGAARAASRSPSRGTPDPMSLSGALEDDGGDVSDSEQADPEYAAKVQGQTEKERVFGRLAPLVLDAPSQLPDALTILKDWGNNCLDDLQALDGVGGASLSSRFSSFTTELRDGIIVSRLLFYLALPRYRPPSINKNDDLEDVNPDFTVNRARLLRQSGVQLHSPFPTYDDCFGDLMRFPPVKRMGILLHFASELISGTHRLTPDQVDALEALQLLSDHQSEREDISSETTTTTTATAQDEIGLVRRTSSPQLKRRSSSKVLLHWMDGVQKNRRGSTAFGDDAAAAFPSTSEFLPQYVDPTLLCEGSKSAAVTLLAILYVRFAHAFNHKAQETAAKEAELMRALLKDQGSPLMGASAGFGSPGRALGGSQSNKLDNLLGAIDEEEKSPWQIFLDRCKPFFTSSAHGFVLEGNFWSALSCESAEMLEVFSAVSCALHRSLETHRWHITMQCLTPLISSTGMTRGCFSGMLASTDYYLYQRSCESQDVSFHPEVVYFMAAQRKELPATPSPEETVSKVPHPLETPPVSPPSGSVALPDELGPLLRLEPSADGFDEQEFRSGAYFQSLHVVLQAFTDDLARVFLGRATTHNTMLTPTMSVTAWRMLWMDAGLCPGRVSLEAITFMFSDSCQSHNALTFASHHRKSGGGMSAAEESTTSSDHHPGGAGGQITSLQEMTFDAFLEGCLRVANYRYAPVSLVSAAGASAAAATHSRDMMNSSFSPGASFQADFPPPLPAFHTSPSVSRAPSANPGKKRVFTTLQEAFTRLMVDAIIPLHPMHSPPVVLQHLKQGVLVQDLLRRRNAELLSVFQAYAKVHLGITALEKEDALRMIKDAGLATAELSYQVVSELFVECSFKRTAADQGAMNAMDPWHIDAPYGGGHGGSIFQSTSNSTAAFVGGSSIVALHAMAAQQQRNSATRNQQSLMQQANADRLILDFPAFVDFLCVLLLYKLPNPFQPMHLKLEHFLDRNVIAPLRFRVDQAAKARARRRDTSVSAGGGKVSSLVGSVQQQPLAPPPPK